MGDGLKLAKDKRHRSSSSLAGVVLEGTRSERKLEMNASIPEMDDQFTTAEARCDDLQEKIDLIKSLKRKRKLKKRSMTRVSEPPKTPDKVPFITVRTQPKKKVSQQASRLRRLEVPPNPTRGYLDPATVEQHRMLGQVRGYNQAFRHPVQENIAEYPTSSEQRAYPKLRRQRSQADGDSISEQRGLAPSEGLLEVACGQEDISTDYDGFDMYQRPSENQVISKKKPVDVRPPKQSTSRRRHVPKEVLPKEAEQMPVQWRGAPSSPQIRHRVPSNKSHHSTGLKESFPSAPRHTEERPVVELFSKSRNSPTDIRQGAAPLPPMPPIERKTKKVIPIRHPPKIENDESMGPLEQSTDQSEFNKKDIHHPRRVKYRSRRYELPTVASQMKQAGMRYYYGTSNHTNIPFVVSKSTAPSHNIGVNIQQVLNGLKIQQPLSGIPLTIAHHMGLGHVPTYGAKSATVTPSLDHREINAIRLGRRLLRLPSYKYMSYNRLLTLYREGDGMVPRFLRAISRPHYFYTSMYNLATNRDDFDGATSKGRGGSHEAKQSLAEYANLYREYEHIDKCIKEGNYEPELEQRRDELTKELAAREEHIRRVVQEFRSSGEVEQPLRATASTAEEGYRHSAYKMVDPQQ